MKPKRKNKPTSKSPKPLVNKIREDALAHNMGISTCVATVSMPGLPHIYEP